MVLIARKILIFLLLFGIRNTDICSAQKEPDASITIVAPLAKMTLPCNPRSSTYTPRPFGKCIWNRTIPAGPYSDTSAFPCTLEDLSIDEESFTPCGLESKGDLNETE